MPLDALYGDDEQVLGTLAPDEPPRPFFDTPAGGENKNVYLSFTFVWN